MGKWRTDSAIEFLGRKDEQVKVRGHRIEPGEIESLLRQYETIEDAAVTVFVNKSGDQELVAYVASHDELNAAVLRNFLVTRLPAYMIPAHFVPAGAPAAYAQRQNQ